MPEAIFKRNHHTDSWEVKGYNITPGEIVNVTQRDGKISRVEILAITGVGLDSGGEYKTATFKNLEDKPVRRDRSPFPDLRIELDPFKTTRELLRREIEKEIKEEEVRPADKTVPPPSPSSTSLQISTTVIAQAAHSVIAPRLAQAKDELKAEIEKRIKEAAKSFYIGDEANRQIAQVAQEIAKDVALNAIERATATYHNTIEALKNAIPRRLEIKTEKSTRVLPAEARHKVFDEILLTLLSGEHVYLVGEAGTGKTHMFRQLGEALGQKTTILGQTLTKYEFSGHLGPTGEYVPTLLRKSVEEGHLICIDEIDTSASAAIVFLNSLLANRFIAFPDATVEAHPDFKLIAAANTFGFGATPQYVGRNPLDAASLDRFTYIECHYDEDLERSLYGDNPWTTYVHRVRSAVNKLELRHVISMRAIDRGRKLLAQGLDAEKVCSLALWRNLPSDTISRIKNLSGTFTRRLEEAAD